MLHSLEEEIVEEKSWDEEAPEEEDDLGNLPSLPPKGSGTGIKPRISLLSQQFDADNKGHLNKDEQKARDMLNKDGTVKPEKLVDQVQTTKKLKRIIAFLVVLGAVSLFLGIILNTRATSKQTQATIYESVETKNVEDGRVVRTMDKNSNVEVTMRAEGDEILARHIVDPVTKQEAFCLPMDQVAQATLGVQHGTDVRISTEDPAHPGVASRSYAVSQGNFEDKTSYLAFQSGTLKIMFNSHRCDMLMLPQSDEEEDDAEDQDLVVIEEEVVEEVEGEEEENAAAVDGNEVVEMVAEDQVYVLDIEASLQAAQQGTKDERSKSKFFNRVRNLFRRGRQAMTEESPQDDGVVDNENPPVADPARRVKVVKKSSSSLGSIKKKNPRHLSQSDLQEHNRNAYFESLATIKDGRSRIMQETDAYGVLCDASTCPTYELLLDCTHSGYTGADGGTTSRICATFHTPTGSGDEVCQDPSTSSCPSFATTLWEDPTRVDLVIHGTVALLVDKVVLKKDWSDFKTWWNDDMEAVCFSSNPDHECWNNIHRAEYARRGVSFSMSGRSANIGYHCIRVVTDPDHQWANGGIEVLVDSGNGYTSEARGYYQQGNVVLDKCFASVAGVKVNGANNDNGWGGSIEMSIDSGKSYSPMICDNCSGSDEGDVVYTSSIFWVDNNGSGQPCKSGGDCILSPLLSSDVTCDANPGDISEANEIFNQLTTIHTRLINCESYLTKLHIANTNLHAHLVAMTRPFREIGIVKKVISILLTIYDVAKMKDYPEPYGTVLQVIKETLELIKCPMDIISPVTMSLSAAKWLVDEIREDAQNLSYKAIADLAVFESLYRSISTTRQHLHAQPSCCGYASYLSSLRIVQGTPDANGDTNLDLLYNSLALCDKDQDFSLINNQTLEDGFADSDALDDTETFVDWAEGRMNDVKDQVEAELMYSKCCDSEMGFLWNMGNLISDLGNVGLCWVDDYIVWKSGGPETLESGFQFLADQTLNPKIDSVNDMIALISFDPNLYPGINLPDPDEWIHDVSSCTFGGTQLSLTLAANPIRDPRQDDDLPIFCQYDSDCPGDGMKCGSDNCMNSDNGLGTPSDDCCEADLDSPFTIALIPRIEFDFGNVGTLQGLAEGCSDAVNSVNWDNSECCGPMRIARGYPPEGAAEGDSCQNNIDCTSALCPSSGTCEVPFILYPNGSPCNQDGDCESGNCQLLGVVSSGFCWGTNKNYKIYLYDYMISGSGTPSIDIYIVNNDEYAQSNTYQRKIVDGPVSYRGGSKQDQCPTWNKILNTCFCGSLPCTIQPKENKDLNMWRSSKWTCGDQVFHGSDWGYSVIICNNSGNGLFIDRLEIRKGSSYLYEAKSFGAHGGGGYCPSTDSSDTFSGKCSSGAFQCIQFKMDGSTVRGVSKPSSEKEGLCSA